MTTTAPGTTPAPEPAAPAATGLERLTGFSRSLRSSEGGGSVPARVRRGRPALVTRYSADQGLLNTPAKRWWTVAALVLALVAPFYLTRDLTLLVSSAMVMAIAGIGLNLLTGYAGQISLGHPFFMALGAYTAAVVSGRSGGAVWGLELDLAIALPLAALVPAVVGFIVAPLAMRVRGLYLAVLTLGLLMLGEQLFKQWASLTGGSGVGRRGAEPVLFGNDLSIRYAVGPVIVDKNITLYLICLAALIILGVMARNLARSRTGRSFAAVRDRDIAAEIMGVNLLRTKTLAFTISSAYAGLAGALGSLLISRMVPEQWNIFMSIQLLAVIVIGGVATVTADHRRRLRRPLPPVLEESRPTCRSSAAAAGRVHLDLQLESILGALIVSSSPSNHGACSACGIGSAYFKTWPFSY